MSWTMTAVEKKSSEIKKRDIIDWATEAYYVVDLNNPEGGHYDFDMAEVERRIKEEKLSEQGRSDVLAHLNSLLSVQNEPPSRESEDILDIGERIELGDGGDEPFGTEKLFGPGMEEADEEEGVQASAIYDFIQQSLMRLGHLTEEEFEEKYSSLLSKRQAQLSPEAFTKYKEDLKSYVQQKPEITIEKLKAMPKFVPEEPVLSSELPAAITLQAKKNGLLFPVRECFGIAREAYSKMKVGKSISWDEITKIVEKYSDRIKKLAIRVYDVNEKSMDFGQAYYEMSFKVAIGIEQLLENDGYGYHPDKEAWYKVRG